LPSIPQTFDEKTGSTWSWVNGILEESTRFQASQRPNFDDDEKAYFWGSGSIRSLESTMPISTRRLVDRASGLSPLARGSDLPKPLVVITPGLIPA
jgi:hypothetical protein